jgi:energy-coupling factor transporter ATP-binding protein EcfA2
VAKKKGKRGAEDDKPKRYTSFFVDGPFLYEQTYSEGQTAFIEYDTTTDEAATIPTLETISEIIAPNTGDDVELGAVKLPSDIEKYGNTLKLLTDIEQHINRYLDVTPNYLKFAAYYVLLSWLYDRFNTLPYLRALGDTGCGKSRLLDVIGGLCYKAICASGCVTVAPIYRMQRRWGGTLVLDEADMKSSDEMNEVVTILNCGFERGRPVLRATKDNPDKIQVLPVYGPKVFATRRRFKDAALEARCLTEIMTETDRDDIPPVLGKRFYNEQLILRNKLLLFRLRNYYKVEPEAATSLNLDGIEPRLRQISEAFGSMFAKEPDVLKSYKDFIGNHQRELIEQRAATPTGRVVESLFELLSVTSETSVTSVTGNSLINFSGSDIAEKTGMTPQSVGLILKGLGIKTERGRVDGKQKRCIVYDKKLFSKLQRRYVFEDVRQVVLSTIGLVTDVTVVTDDEENMCRSTVTNVTSLPVDDDKGDAWEPPDDREIPLFSDDEIPF